MFDAGSVFIYRHGPLKFIEHLLAEEKRKVLLLDEHQVGSTTVALAALRGSFEGIWSSSTNQENLTAFRLSQQIINNRDFFVLHHQNSRCIYGKECQGEEEEWWHGLDSNIECLSASDLRRLDMKFAANKIGEASTEGVPKQLVWLNFPWYGDQAELPSYLVDFVNSCAAVQDRGGVMLITMTEDDMWTSHYGDISSLVKTAEGLGYSHYEDDQFVSGRLQHYGYQHRTANDARVIHHYVVPHSTTHIFIKT